MYNEPLVTHMMAREQSRAAHAKSSALAVLLVLSALAGSCFAQAELRPETAKKPAAIASTLPPDVTVAQRIRSADGLMLRYDVTVGSVPVFDEDNGEQLGQVAFTAYVLEGPEPAARPIAFAFNGGPGASSVYLHLGLIGPKRIDFATTQETPSSSPLLHDNPHTWLSFTDVVFVDPVGTGYSRPSVDKERAKRAFWGVSQDVSSMAQFIASWLAKNGRMISAKYLIGESYAGIRVPKMAYRLQKNEGIGVSGIVLLSPALDRVMTTSPDVSPLPWVARLPSMAAAYLERQGRLTPAAMADVEAYARGPYLQDLLAGRQDPAAVERASERVAALIGLDPALVKQLGARVNNFTFTRQVLREEGMFVSAYDTAVTNFDPFPYSAERRGDDATLQGSIAPLTSAIVHYTRESLGWRPEGAYVTLNMPINRGWQHEDEHEESVSALRLAMGLDPNLRVLIAHGYTDVRTPYFASKLIVDQIPSMGDSARLRFAVYAGGHMFYTRAESRTAFLNDVRTVFGADRQKRGR